MSYQVLARKWRPQRFSEVLGQEHITRTLQNAITSGRVGHAYLFVGPRGIGKTTSARIFAKALNCEAPVQDENGIEPCCKCSSCTEIAAGNCLDVIEIDGASYNKVEDIRELCENVQYSPTNGRSHKIYIIDEVHMLTTQAWNALLKTLEEPPDHVKFLFATTEAHKVLATILSRTQRFDLKRIPVPVIVQRLRQIADEEKIFIDDDALAIIARAAEGGMRDAQSAFDQMIAFCGGMDEASRIHESDVIDVFGLASHDELIQLQTGLLTNDAATVVAAVHHLADQGRDLERLYADLLQGLRNLMIHQVAEVPETVLELGPGELEELQVLGADHPPALTQRLAEGMLRYSDEIRHCLNKRVFVEVTLLKVMRDAHAMRVDDLLTQLRQLKDLPGPADPPAPRPAPAAETAPGPAAASQPQTPAAAPAPQPAAAPAAKPATPQSTNPAQPASESQPPAQAERRLEASSKVYNDVTRDPFVRRICDVFHGQVIDVRG